MKGKSVRIRRRWRINPMTRVKESDKKYKRPKEKERFRKRSKREA